MAYDSSKLSTITSGYAEYTINAAETLDVLLGAAYFSGVTEGTIIRTTDGVEGALPYPASGFTLSVDGTGTAFIVGTSATASIAASLGAVNSVTGLTCSARWDNNSRIGVLDFTLSNVSITHTDAAGSGSSGSVKLFDFVQGAWQSLGCRTNLTLTGDALIDGNQGDIAGVFALGSVAANAGDGALSGTEVDFAAAKAFTMSGGTIAVGTNLTTAGAAGVDGTATASDLYLNESCSAATSDANGVITVSGTISLTVAKLGDD